MINGKFLMLASATALMLSGCGKEPETTAPSGNTAAPVTAAAPAGNWVETTSKTAEGGMLMGNPAAAVKLIEYGALTCSHCADFSKQSSAGLRTMIATGKVSYEFRNYLLNVIDVPAALLARCAGPGPFFTIAEQMFAKQPEWLGKASSITPADQQSWQSFPPELLATVLAEKLNLDTFVKERGISISRSKACLADKAAIEELGNMSKVGSDKWKITGTPTFIINGRVVPNVGTWDALKPELVKAGA